MAVNFDWALIVCRKWYAAPPGDISIALLGSQRYQVIGCERVVELKGCLVNRLCAEEIKWCLIDCVGFIQRFLTGSTARGNGLAYGVLLQLRSMQTVGA